MKNRPKIILILLFGLLLLNLKSQHILILKDGENKFSVPFDLINNGKIIFSSDDNGKLELSEVQFSNNSDLIVNVSFSNNLDGILYKNKLYFQQGINDKDVNIPFDSVKLNDLIRNEITVYYMREKQNLLETSPE